MKKPSAGILLYKFVSGNLHFFLVHPGGPYWKNKDDSAWSIPKGEYDEDEDPLAAAKREFFEETGQKIDAEEFIELPQVKSTSGKVISAWLAKGDVDAETVVSNTCEIEWPPRSGKRITIPEVDRGEWFTYEVAVKKIHGYLLSILEAALEVIESLKK
jgi:predicted NUDIX family NTP pyrophosphohydrolase